MKSTQLVGTLSVAPVAGAAAAQETEDALPTMRSAKPLELRFEVSHFQGEKKLAGLPYSLALLDDAGAGSGRVRMGIDVPIRVKEDSGEIQYRSVDTNVDCPCSSPGSCSLGSASS